MASQQDKTKRITKAAVLEYAALYFTGLENVELSNFTIECYNWIVKKSGSTDENIRAKFALEYALRVYNLPPMVYKEEPTLDKVFDLAEKLYIWTFKNGKSDKDLMITANTAIDRTLKLIASGIIELEDLDGVLSKIKNYYKWMIS